MCKIRQNQMILCREGQNRGTKWENIYFNENNENHKVYPRWLSPGTRISSTNKTDRHDITKILLKVALNTINLTK